MNQLIQDLQQESFRKMYSEKGVSFVGLFGSYARGDENELSDIDLLIDFNDTKSLFELAQVKIFFQERLGKKVDLALKGRLKKTLEDYVLKDLIKVYDEN